MFSFSNRVGALHLRLCAVCKIATSPYSKFNFVLRQVRRRPTTLEGFRAKIWIAS